MSFFAIGQEDCMVKTTTIARHAQRHHGRIERIRRPRKRQREDDDEDQQPRRKLKKASVTEYYKRKIRDQNLLILSSGQVCALNTFQKQEFIDRDKLILEMVGFEPEIADEISTSRNTTKRDIIKMCEENRQKIRTQLPVVATKKSGVGLSIDHKNVERHSVTNQTKFVLGTSITITDDDGERLSYLLGFPATIGEGHDEGEEVLTDLLDDYGILQSVQDGQIIVNSDYMCNGLADRFTSNNAVDPNHTMDRILKRMIKELMPKFSENCATEFRKLKALTNYAHKTIPKKQLRNLPPELEPSLNDLLLKKGLRIIESYTEVRFRSLYISIKSIMNVKTVLLELVNDQTDPNHRHVLDLPNMAYLEALHDFLENAFMELVNFCDGEKQYQAGEYLPQIESLLQWACSEKYQDNEFGKQLQNCLIAAVMEQLIGSYLHEGTVFESSVRPRLLPNDIAIMYGTFPRKNCLLEKVRHILKAGGRDQEAKMVKQFAKGQNFKQIAQNHIQLYDTMLNGVPDLDYTDSNLLQEFAESDDSDDSPAPSTRSSARSSSRSLSNSYNRRSASSSLNRSSASSSSFRIEKTPIEQELQKYEELDTSYVKTFATFAETCGWNFRKDATGFILQNEHNQKYWEGMIHILPRMTKIMLFLLKNPVSSSNLERFFSTITLNSSSHATKRDMEYLEEINQINPKSKNFFETLDRLYHA